MSPKIAIIGGSSSRLTLSRLLNLQRLRNTIFELEASSSARSQSGSLDLHENSGQRALRAAGLYGSFKKIACEEDQGLCIADKTGKLHVNVSGDRGKPEVDRVGLRQSPLESIPFESVRWGCKLQKITAAGEGCWDLHFTNGTKEGPFDLVVGADGAWSKVRTALSNTVPFYSGLGGVELRIISVDTKHRDFADLVGHGAFLALSDEKGLLAQRNGDGSVMNYVMMRTPETWIEDCGINFSDTEKAAGLLVEKYFSDWDEKLQDLVRKADGVLIPRKLFMLPIGFRWEARKGVTLLGDVAHLMTPFTGEGVNTAMLDAVELAEEIGKVKDGWSTESVFEAVRRYESTMLDRSEEKMRKVCESLELVFEKNSPISLLESLAKMQAYYIQGRE